jgi:hypothetical protein
MKLIAWIAAILLVAVPTGLLIYKPTLLTPLASSLLNGIQFFLALWLGYVLALDAATKSANAKWLPPAESSCDRLLTVTASVGSLRAQTSGACAKASTDLPELKDPKNKAVRILLERQCAETANRLLDIENHLESALQDWQRFIRQNCEGRECGRIWHELKQRQTKLASQISGGTTCASSPAPETPPAPPSLPSSTLVLTVTESSGTPNGIWTMLQTVMSPSKREWACEAYTLREEAYGWRIIALKTGEALFWLERSALPYGAFLPCEMCPTDGVAIVSEDSRRRIPPGNMTEAELDLAGLASESEASLRSA